jgi:hypothetical protein
MSARRCRNIFGPLLALKALCVCLAAVSCLALSGRVARVAPADDGAAAAARRPSLQSGRQVGESVPEFHSRVVTGPLRNRSVCYVCRNGGRPVVMLLLRRVGPEIEPLLRDIDRLVDANRAAGLRSFAVVLCDEPGRAAPEVQTFAFDHKIDTPLSVATDAVAAPNCQNVHPDAAVTVVLYRQRRVESTFAFRDDELNERAYRDVVEQVRSFADGGQAEEER